MQATHASTRKGNKASHMALKSSCPSKAPCRKGIGKPRAEMVISIAVPTTDLYLVHMYESANQKNPTEHLKVDFVEEEVSKVIQHMENAKPH